MTKLSGVQIAAHGIFVGDEAMTTFVSRGWGLFSKNPFVKDRAMAELRIIKICMLC